MLSSRLTPRKTGEDKYIYIHYKKKVRSSAKKIKLYERYKETLKINYGKSRVKFHTEDEKIATVNKKGVVTAVKKGTTYITIKVKDSEKKPDTRQDKSHKRAVDRQQ